MQVISKKDLKSAKNLLEQGEIVAVPTETVYGLAVKLNNQAGVKKLLKLKERQPGSGKVLTMMLPSVKEIEKYAVMNQRAKNLAIRYFPGELTMILPKRKDFKHHYFDYFDTVGIRIPEHRYMLNLLDKVGALLVTSANLRGKPPYITSEAIKTGLPKLGGVVKGEAGGRLPSTVLDLTANEPLVLRQGGLLIVHY